MTTRRLKKSKAELFLEGLHGPLTLTALVDSIRIGEDWTKREMSERLKVSPSYYSDFIAGKKPLSPQKAALWADILGYDRVQFIELAIQDQLERNKLNYKVQLMA
jgi:transcriptional regulator with XRE-family HTH domain